MLQRTVIAGVVSALGLFSYGIAGNSVVAQEKRGLDRRLREEGPRGWSQYLAFARRLQVTWQAARSGAPNSKALSIRTECKQGTSAAVRVQSNLEPATEAEAIGANPLYTFTLKRRDSQRGWTLVKLKLSKQSKTPDKEQKEVQEDVRREVCNFLTLFNLWLPDLLHDADFKVKSVRPVSAEGLDLVKVEFDYRKRPGNYPVRGALQITGGWMLLDPQHDWIMREYEVYHFSPENSLIHRQFRFKAGTDGHLLLTQVKTRIRGKEGGATFDNSWETEVETLERADMPVTEFTLSAFGLPEPRGVTWERGSSRWWLWFTVAAGVLLVVGGYLSHRVQQRKKMLSHDSTIRQTGGR